METEQGFDWRECFITFILLALNTAVYIYCTYVGGTVYNKGCLDAEFVLLDSEYYRFITSIFMHSGIDHIVSNMIFLVALGEMLEKAIGHFRFCLLYMLSGIGGGIFSIANSVLSGNHYTAVGASGAIFGLIGALLIIVIINNGAYKGISIKRMIFAIIYMVYSGMRSEGIDNAAHVGGLIFGVLIMAAIYVRAAFANERR